MSIKFNSTYYDENEALAIAEVLYSGVDYLKIAKQKLQDMLQSNVYLTSNGSSALDLLFLAYDFSKGSEVILPSFTYPSALNSILRAGLKPIFCDIDPNTLVMDIDDAKTRKTDKTVCIIPTHYGGASCDIDMLRHEFGDVKIIEDAALSIDTKYNSKPLGTLCDAGIISLHNTKNVSADEGGIVIINDERLLQKIKIIYENGTDRQAFLDGEVNFYSWQDVGMNASMSNISAAVLSTQIDKMDEILERHAKIYDSYLKHLMPVANKHDIRLPVIPSYNENNAHVFYVIFEDESQRDSVKQHLNSVGIEAVIHYVPLHMSTGWEKIGKPLSLPVTEHVAKCMLRLPMHAKMKSSDCATIAYEIGRSL